MSTSDRILDIAEAQFALNGYNGTTIDEIARAVKIKRSSLLYHFPSKPELYIAVLERLLETQLARITPVYHQDYASHWERFIAITDRWIDCVVENSHYTSMLMHHAGNGFSDEFEFWQRTHKMGDMWENIIQEGIAAGEFRQVSVYSIFSLISGYTSFFLVLGKNHDTGEFEAAANTELRHDLVRSLQALLKE